MENDKNIKDIDFSPLYGIDHAWREALKTKYLKTPLWIFAIICLLPIAISMLQPKFLGLSFIGTLPIVAFAFIYAKKIKDLQKNSWKEFARNNGWQVIEEDNLFVKYIPPSLFRLKDTKSNTDGVVAKFSNLECIVFMYEYVVGSGENATTYYHTVARVQLKKQLPHIILDSTKNKSGIRNYGSASELIHLEGNFNDYFKLYIEKNSQIDALSILSPDVMQVLIESNQAQDIEIEGDSLFFIAHTDQRSPDNLKKLLMSVDALATELKNKIYQIS